MPDFWRRVRKINASGGPAASRRDPMPVVVGSPRSGTTLLRFMLDSHSELAIPPETGFLTLGEHLTGRGDELRARFFSAVVNYPESAPVWPDFEIPEETFRAALNEIKPFNVSDGFRAFYRLYAARHGKPRWGDKTPIYCLHMDAIRRVLPEARFIHIIRDFVRVARRAGAGRPDYLELRYEDLILNTRETLERVCTHVGLSFEPGMLCYYERTPERLREHKGRSRPDGTPLLTQEQRLSQQEATTAPPDTRRVYGWKEAMSPDERQRFGRVAGDLLRELGYEP